MPTVTFDKKDLLNLLNKKINDNTLSYYISYLGTDLKTINDREVIVEIFPNRPDMLSIEGFARALKAFMGLKSGLIKYKVNKSNNRILVDNNVKKVRPFIRGAIVKNLSMNEALIKSLMNMQEKLHKTHGRNRRKVAIGIHDFDKIKFPIRYKAVDPKKISFTPLNESIEMNLNEILANTTKGKEYSWILEDKEKYPILIDAKDDVVSFPPIINGVVTQVRTETRNIFIDVTGEDEEAVEKALNIIVTSLADRGGKIFSIKIDGKESPKLKPKSLRLNTKYASRILGLNLNETKIKKLLKKMGYDYSNAKVSIPCYRTDILHQFDIIEDMAIAYGYDKFEPEIPNIATIAEEDEEYAFSRRLSELLIGFGFLEANTNNLTKEEEEKKTGFNDKIVKIRNSLNQEYTGLRRHILPALMKVLSENKHYEYPQEIFEINSIFSKDENFETGVKEELDLGIVMAGIEKDFTKIKEVVDALFKSLNLTFDIEEYSSETFIEGRGARIISEGEELGYFGEINPEVIESFQLDMPVVGAEINVTHLFNIIKELK